MDGDEAVSLGVGGAFSRKRKPPSDSTLEAGIAPALWGFASPESTYRASMGAPPRRIEQRTHGSEPPTEGRGRTKHARSVRPALGCGVSFASFLCPDQRKEGDTPESKRSPPEVSTSGGFALVGSEYVPIDIVVSVHEQLPRECLIIDVAL